MDRKIKIEIKAKDVSVDKVCSYIPFYTKNVNNPGETFFLSIHKGDTPENSEFAKHALMLVDMVLEKEVAKKATKK